MYPCDYNQHAIMDKESKEKKYRLLEVELSALISAKDGLISNLANFTAAVNNHFNFFWIGFYLVQDKQLSLGPFQGPVACTKIAYGKGVCGVSWSKNKTILVADVHQFPGHIACSSETNSEIVVPLLNSAGQVMAVLDIDSIEFDYFDEIDQRFLEKIIKWFASEVY